MNGSSRSFARHLRSSEAEIAWRGSQWAASRLPPSPLWSGLDSHGPLEARIGRRTTPSRMPRLSLPQADMHISPLPLLNWRNSTPPAWLSKESTWRDQGIRCGPSASRLVGTSGRGCSPYVQNLQVDVKKYGLNVPE